MRRSGLALLPLLLGCERAPSEAESTFYQRKIAPILVGSCAASPTTSGCHLIADDRGNAFGNLSVESYETLALRRDLLIDYGPYGLPNLLLKVIKPTELRLSSWDDEVQIVTTAIPHQGGALLDITGTSFTQLERWIENGAAENNAPPAPPEVPLQPCREQVGQDPAFDASSDPAAGDFALFRDSVNPLLGERCAAGNCHGSPANQLYLSCGTSPEQVRWNHFAAGDYVSADAPKSEMLRRTLATSQGGTYHEGGTIFASTSDPGYQALLGWAEQKQGAPNVPADAGFEMFAKRVQPMLAKKGCMILGCHSPAMFHDYRLRGGSGGHFGLPATRKNYQLTLEQVALESPDPNASRLIRKNLPPTAAGGGILHRGGPLLAGGGDPTACDLDAVTSGPVDVPDDPSFAYCVLVAWIAKEREERVVAAGLAPLSAIVYVKRAARSGPDQPQDFESFQAGADLMSVPASLDAGGSLSIDGAPGSLLGACGLDPASTDLRRPAVSWDAKRIAFSARTGADEPWHVWVIDDGACAIEPGIAAPPVDDDGEPVPDHGELVHDFDPSFAPDGRIVFASTRGNTKNVGAFDYQGPTRTPADPARLNANLYVLEQGRVRQLTFLLNQELSPSFMSDGRLIFTTEKRAPGFYQLAGRRLNLDGGDYHPLFAQRGSVGHAQATEIVELYDKNLAMILSERGAAHGAGTLAIVNRSIGIDQRSEDPDDFPLDPAAIGYPNPDFYQHSIQLPDPDATGRLSGTEGAYRSPSPLPNRRLLVSHAPAVSDLGGFSGGFAIYEIDPVSGARAPLVTDADDDLLWPVAVHARHDRGVFESRIDEANGHTEVYRDAERRDRSDVTLMDVPLIASLLFQNTRSGRLLPEPAPIEVWEELPPEPGVESLADAGSYAASDALGDLYVRRRQLGQVAPLGDGSARVQIPGGIPIVLRARVQLSGDAGPVLHFQREQMQFYPGEWAHQSFRRGLFDGLCGGCHGSVSGLESHVAVKPDILTQASQVLARDAPPTVLIGTAGAPVGPPFE